MTDSLVLNSTQSETIVHTLNKLIDLWIVILFGSYAKGRARDESDIDAVMADRLMTVIWKRLFLLF